MGDEYRLSLNLQSLRAHISRSMSRVVEESEVREWLMRSGFRVTTNQQWLAGDECLADLPREHVTECVPSGA